ncbi:MAG: hypothetical protein WCQ21_32125, partial [Verrucomicrobiota bacterium]
MWHGVRKCNTRQRAPRWSMRGLWRVWWEADKNVRAPANGGACDGARTFLSAERGMASASAIRASGHRDGTGAVFGACGGKRTRMSALQR